MSSRDAHWGLRLNGYDPSHPIRIETSMSQSIDRRDFLKATTVAVAVAGLNSASASDAKPARVVDTNLHCFAGIDNKRFPYHPRGPYQPKAAATPEHLLACMDGAGVDYAIVVHAEPYQDDHSYLEYALHVGKGRLKGTCLVFADQPASMAQLAGLAKKLPIAAARIHAYAPERLPPFGRPELRALCKQATELGLMLQLHLEPRYAPALEPLIQEFTQTTFIIDHLGRPFQGSPEEHAVVVRWSRFKNTVMKLSAIPSQNNYPHRKADPIIKQLVAAYGPDRLIYGGGFDYETTPESYKAVRERTRGYIADLSAEDQAKVLGGNAVKLYDFKS